MLSNPRLTVLRLGQAVPHCKEIEHEEKKYNFLDSALKY